MSVNVDLSLLTQNLLKNVILKSHTNFDLEYYMERMVGRQGSLRAVCVPNLCCTSFSVLLLLFFLLSLPSQKTSLDAYMPHYIGHHCWENCDDLLCKAIMKHLQNV